MNDNSLKMLDEFEEELNDEIDNIIDPKPNLITREELDYEIDSILYSKPVAFVKKLIRKIK